MICEQAVLAARGCDAIEIRKVAETRRVEDCLVFVLLEMMRLESSAITGAYFAILFRIVKVALRLSLSAIKYSVLHLQVQLFTPSKVPI